MKYSLVNRELNTDLLDKIVSDNIHYLVMNQETLNELRRLNCLIYHDCPVCYTYRGKPVLRYDELDYGEVDVV